jgi:hypothetical protein
MYLERVVCVINVKYVFVKTRWLVKIQNHTEVVALSSTDGFVVKTDAVIGTDT